MKPTWVAVALLACAGPPAAPAPEIMAAAAIPDIDIASCPSDLAPAEWASRAVSVRVVLGPGVTVEQATDRLAIARTLWRREGVSLQIDPRFGHTRSTAAFVAAGSDPFEWTAPIRGLIWEHATPARGGVVVVLMPTVLDPASPIARSLDALDGYTWMPGDDGAVAHAVNAPLDADPVVFAGVDAARRIPASHPDTTLAHELGHAFGLSHSGRVGGLMTPGSQACLPTLDAAERAIVLAGTP